MKDDKLKKFIQTNSNVPPPPSNEWKSIAKNIDYKSKSFSPMARLLSKEFKLGITITAMLVITAVSFQSHYNENNINLSKIESFILDDSYFSEEDELYAWVK